MALTVLAGLSIAGCSKGFIWRQPPISDATQIESLASTVDCIASTRWRQHYAYATEPLIKRSREDYEGLFGILLINYRRISFRYEETPSLQWLEPERRLADSGIGYRYGYGTMDLDPHPMRRAGGYYDTVTKKLDVRFCITDARTGAGIATERQGS